MRKKSKKMKEANLEGKDLRHLDDPKQRESTCKCKSHEKQAWGLCSLSTKTNLIFFLYQENHRMILAKYGGGGEGGCSCYGWKRPPGGQGANTHLPPVPVGRQLCEVWLRGLWSCVRMPGG